MKTNTASLISLLETHDVVYVIPAYQRAYSWTPQQCDELWHDIGRAAASDSPHFIGTLLYAEERGGDGDLRRRIVIDGQQRLTTVVLLLAALARRIDATCEFSGNLSRSIEDRYLRLSADPESPGKLQLGHGDRDALNAIVHRKPLPDNAPDNIRSAFDLFGNHMGEEGFDSEVFWQGLAHLVVIEARADDTDNAQLIFESLNSKGVPLSTADLVRNYLLIAKDHDEQTRLYDEYWSAIEGMFLPDPGSRRLDNAIQGWLSVRFRKVRAQGPGEVYRVFKRYVEEEFDGTTESLLFELRRFCLVWAENYRYHAVKKYRSACSWASNGPATLVSHLPLKPPSDEASACKAREGLDALDASL